MSKSLTSPSDHVSYRASPAVRFGMTLLNRLSHGALLVKFPDGQTQRVGKGQPVAEVDLHDFQVFSAMAEGDIGVAESYMNGHWDTPDLPALLGLFLRNRGALDRAIYGTWWGRLIHRLQLWRHRNTRRQARRNISAHYDLGNNFYSLWLDATMTYSSACFDGDPSRSLAAAQTAKYQRILAQLQVPPGGHVLEIGTGWGGFMAEAAQHELSVTGLTLSARQQAYAQQRLADIAGVAASARYPVAMRDYRDEHAQYDGIVSIEMFEAVGEQYWDAYFATLARCLKRGGRAVVQTIVLAPELFARYRKTPDFIRIYIFPGGMLPSVDAFRQAARRQKLAITEAFHFGADYARTLRAWLSAFAAQHSAVRALGFDEPFVRMWTFYLAYCIAAFEHGNTDVVQFTLQHAD